MPKITQPPPNPEFNDGELFCNGIVRELLPNALFRVDLADGRKIFAHSIIRKKLLRGDSVHVELTKNDPGYGHIIRKIRRQGDMDQ